MVARPRDQRLDLRVRREALRALDEVGLAGFTVETVASRAGVHKTTIYTRWPSRLHLLGDVLAEVVRESPPPEALGTADARGRLERLVQAEMAFARTPAARAVVMLALDPGQGDESGATEPIRSAWNLRCERPRHLLRDLVGPSADVSVASAVLLACAWACALGTNTDDAATAAIIAEIALAHARAEESDTGG